MKHIFGIIVLCWLSTAVSAQTRRIAHRSHGGSENERYDNRDGNYGDIRPRLVRVHLESGRDTMVEYWDSLARPYYLDTIPHNQSRGTLPINDIYHIGHIAGRLVM